MLWLHGFGITTCSARGLVSWGDSGEDYDAVLCFSFCFMPIVPIRVLHHSVAAIRAGEEPRTYQFPLRFRRRTIYAAMARRWLWGILILGLISLMALTNLKRKREPIRMVLTSITLIGIGVAGHRFLENQDDRNQRIRLILGRHPFGSSDPVDWPPQLFDGIPSARDLYDTPTFAEAVPRLLMREEYSRAMWAARLAVIFEGERLGEELTDAVLAHPGVAKAVQSVRNNPYRWYAKMVGFEPNGSATQLIN